MASILGIYFPKVIAIAFPIFILLLALLTQEIVYLKTEDRGVQKFDKEELPTLPITPQQLKRQAILTAILLPLAIFLWIVFQKSLDWKVNYLHALWRSLTSPLVILLIVGFLIIGPLVGGMIYFPQIELLENRKKIERLILNETSTIQKIDSSSLSNSPRRVSLFFLHLNRSNLVLVRCGSDC